MPEHGIRERVTGAQRVGHEQRAGEPVRHPRASTPPPPDQPRHRGLPHLAVSAEVVVLATSSALTAGGYLELGAEVAALATI